jgi:hypothetical protein
MASRDSGAFEWPTSSIFHGRGNARDGLKTSGKQNLHRWELQLVLPVDTGNKAENSNLSLGELLNGFA